MNNSKIHKIWNSSYADYCASGSFQSDIQKKTSRAIMNCKSGRLGMNISQCPDCGHLEFHNNSCRNRNCPNCQAVNKEVWVDKRRAEVIDHPLLSMWSLPLPHELNSLVYCNQQLLYAAPAQMLCPRHFWNFLPMKSGSAQHPVSYRSCIHGIRRWDTMYICTVSFPAVD